MKRNARLQSLPFITYMVPSKGASPPGSPNSSHRERCSLARALLQLILKVPCRWTPPPPHFPQLGSYMERHPSQNLLPHISLQHMNLPGFPAGPSFMPPGSPNRAPVKRDAPFPEPSFHCLSQFPVHGPPSPGSPTGPLQRETPVFRTFYIPSLENSSFPQSPP